MRTFKNVAAGLAGFWLLTQVAHAAPPFLDLIAIGTINGSYEDFALETASPLEDHVPGNLLGGVGSGLTYLGGNYFLGLPDRGPNAAPYNSCLDDTTSFIDRFHTLHLSLAPSAPGSALPFTLTPMLVGTQLLSNRGPLVYGAGCGGTGSGVPALNAVDRTNYFTGRSDGFNPAKTSTDPSNARLDPESIRVSNDRRRVYLSDEYGPYVYEFDRETGVRTRVFKLPARFAATVLSSKGDTEISGNTSGRVANKGMEVLAITPDGKTLVGAMQSPLIQDGGDVKGGVTRIITIDIKSGTTREYAYQLDANVKTTISDILAVNDHEFLVDERDSKGLADDSNAAFKRIYKIDLKGAADVSALTGQTALAAKALSKTLFLDIVTVLNVDHGIPVADIPAKLEGITFGQDVFYKGSVKHTLYIANDNDFSAVVANKTHLPGKLADNPNQFFVFAFDDIDLPGFVPQHFTTGDDEDDDHQ